MPGYELTEDLDPDKIQVGQKYCYPIESWNCLIELVNGLYEAHKRCGGSGSLPALKKVGHPHVWKYDTKIPQEGDFDIDEQSFNATDENLDVYAMYLMLKEICPDMIEEPGDMWDRDWLDQVVAILRHGICRDCSNSTDGRTLLFYAMTPGTWSTVTVSCNCAHIDLPAYDVSWSAIPLYPFVDETAYNNQTYVQWVIESVWMFSGFFSDPGIGAPHWDPINGAYPNTGRMLWYSVTKQKMVDYSEMTEDDFFFTDEGLAAMKEGTFIPTFGNVPAITDDMRWAQAWATNGSVPADDLTPYDTDEIDFYSTNSSYGSNSGLLSIGVVPKNYIGLSQDGETRILELCPQARFMWGLRISYRMHLAMRMKNIYLYNSAYDPINGMPVGTRFGGLSGKAFIQEGIIARQWNFGGQQMRIDYSAHDFTMYSGSWHKYLICCGEDAKVAAALCGGALSLCNCAFASGSLFTCQFWQQHNLYTGQEKVYGRDIVWVNNGGGSGDLILPECANPEREEWRY